MPSKISTEERVNWLLRRESLWSDREEAIKQLRAAGLYSKNLSNIDFCVSALIQRCRRIKKASQNPSAPIKPRTDLVITAKNFDELINQREVKDILMAEKHPVKSMDESSFTYWDYAVFKRRKHGKVPQHVLDEINIIFSGGTLKYIY
jgi:hypothetical protein